MAGIRARTGIVCGDRLVDRVWVSVEKYVVFVETHYYTVIHRSDKHPPFPTR